jgi:hypothetical protein
VANESGKKVARVSALGKRTKIKASKGRVFPFAVSAVVILGLLSVFFSRREFTGNIERPPKANADHWHMAFGIYDCDKFLPNLPEPTIDPDGIHTHGDGVIHVHPFNSSASGRRATLQKYFDVVQIDVDGDTITVPGLGENGGEFKRTNGDTCPNGQEGEWRMDLWEGPDDTDPIDVTQGFGIQRFTEDGMFVTLGFIPKGTDMPQPESAPNLAELGRADGGATPVTAAPGSDSAPAPAPSSGSPTSDPAATDAPASTVATTAGSATTAAAPATTAP